jgi:hypothetical protein
MNWRLFGALLAMILLAAGYYAYLDTDIRVTEGCRRNAAGDVACPLSQKLN